jgi:hypothetical protein
MGYNLQADLWLAGLGFLHRQIVRFVVPSKLAYEDIPRSQNMLSICSSRTGTGTSRMIISVSGFDRVNRIVV